MKINKVAIWILLLLFWSGEVAAQTPYFQGKTIRFVVGYPAGSTHDLWARLVGPYMTKLIPGNPNTIAPFGAAGSQLPPASQREID